MIFELRTYTAEAGRTADFLKLYESMALPLQNRYLGGLVGFYVSEVGPLNQIVHLWRFASLPIASNGARRWRPIRPGRHTGCDPGSWAPYGNRNRRS